ncbi:SNF2-like protein [Penicillium sp. CMV-2018d]|nr:SNF2-like protein [Penicillium sp. CMV-2018d]
MATPKAQGKRPLHPQSAGGDNPAKKMKGSPAEEPKPTEMQAARCTMPNNFEQLAAYLSFKTTSELRQFAISWVCLSAESYFATAAKGLAKKQPLRFLNTISGKRQIEAVKDSPVTAWPYTAEDRMDTQINQRKKIVAWCLVKMVADIETYNQATVEANNLKTHQEQQAFLERHKDVASKNGTKLELKFPEKPVGFPKPSMGPFTDLGENQLEVYNRCWELLRYLGTGFHRQNWANRFQSITVLNRGRLVNDTNFPSWMREKAPVPKVSSGLGNFRQVFEWHGPTSIANGTVPNRIQILPWDPRACSTGAQFRDEIRRLFNCKKLGMDILTMRLEYYDGKWQTKTDLNVQQELWEDLRDIMSDPGNSDFKFTVAMESFDRDDPTIDIFEDPHNALNLGDLPALFSVDENVDGHEGPEVEAPPNAPVLEKSA